MNAIVGKLVRYFDKTRVEGRVVDFFEDSVEGVCVLDTGKSICVGFLCVVGEKPVCPVCDGAGYHQAWCDIDRPKGVRTVIDSNSDVHHEWPSPKERRQMKANPLNLRLGKDERGLEKLRLAKLSGPALYPNNSNEEPELIDADDTTASALKAYQSILRRVDSVKRKGGAKKEERLAALREEWREVSYDYGVDYDEASTVVSTADPEVQARIKREAGEVAYSTSRDPSDWQIRAELPESIREELELQKALDVDGELSLEESQDFIYIHRCILTSKAVEEAWHRLFPEDGLQGRIVVKWLKHDGRYVRPLVTIGIDSFVQRRITAKADVLAGLESSLNSLRFRLIKQAQRRKR